MNFELRCYLVQTRLMKSFCRWHRLFLHKIILFLENQTVMPMSYYVVFLMYNFFAATEFSWDDVKVDKHRENYIGHSIKAPVGRWQKGIYSCSRSISQLQLLEISR